VAPHNAFLRRAAARYGYAGMHLAEVVMCTMPLSGMVHTLRIFCEFVT